MRNARRLFVFLALVLTLVVAPTALAGAGTPGVHGGGFIDTFWGDRWTMALNANGVGAAASGTLVLHAGIDLRGEVTCLNVEGGTAVVTGVIERSDRAGDVGQPFAFAVRDEDAGGGSDLIALNVGAPLSCLETVSPIWLPLGGGNFTVR